MPTSTTPGAITTYSTIYSIGIEWDIGATDDTNHDCTVTVRYRIGAGAWRNALNLVRVEFGGRNMLAGSVLFLEPNTTYELELVLSDPDGGASTQTTTVTTRRLPVEPTGGNTYYVIPGSGGGDGSFSNPFQGLASAQAVAIAKDIFFLRTGNYGNFTFSVSGGPALTDYIVWQDAGDGEVTFGAITVSASHLWFEGLTPRNQATGMTASGARTNNVVTRCSFQNNHKAISLNSSTSYWYIADNTIVGDNDPLGGSFSGEGVDMQISDGHTIAHNSISRTADGISYPRANVDIFGNEIFDNSDDGPECDNGTVNVRVWKNRIHMTLHNGITFQDQNGAPWYLIRNQIILDTDEGHLKLESSDRYVLFHNTFVNTQPLEFQNRGFGILNAYSRNNLFAATGAGGSQIWDHQSALVTWRTNLDRDGFDWGTFTGNKFVYNGTGHGTIASYAAATGQETNGINFSAAATFSVGAYTKRVTESHLPPPYLNLKAGASAIDAGVVLNNINEDYQGAAPDLGAYEFGAALPVYGPRVAGPPPPPEEPPAVEPSLILYIG